MEPNRHGLPDDASLYVLTKSFMRRIFFLISIISCFWVSAGCRDAFVPSEQVIKVEDVTRHQVFDLAPTNGKMLQVSFAHFHFQGSIDGDAYFVTQSYATQRVSGSVDMKFAEDVFAQRYLLTYVSDGVKRGILIIKYYLR